MQSQTDFKTQYEGIINGMNTREIIEACTDVVNDSNYVKNLYTKTVLDILSQCKNPNYTISDNQLTALAKHIASANVKEIKETVKVQYRLKLLMHMSLSKGGYTYVYEMVDFPGISVVKTKITRNDKQTQDILFEDVPYKEVLKAIEAWKLKQPTKEEKSETIQTNET